MPNLCNVTGQISDIFADAMGDVSVDFKTTHTTLWRSEDEVISTKVRRVKASDAGEITVDLVPGQYVMTLRTNAFGPDQALITVPDAPSALLHQLLNLPAPTDLNSLEQAVLDAQSARDAANQTLLAVQAIEASLSDGESAYELAQANGFVGTEAEWLASLEGPAGPQGPVGPLGPQGIQGLKGDKGDKGETGDTGPQGLQGEQGIQGPVGPKGDQGDQGIQGIQGIKGDTGDTGPQGVQGPVGPQGETGPQGIQGLKGDQGRGFTVLGNFATVGELPGSGNTAGDAYSVGSTSPRNIYIWDGTNLTWDNIGPLEGPVGPQGPQGEAGSQGPQGPIGLTGNTGPQGDTGLQGPAGPKGDTGDTGPIGPQGIQGSKGDTGSQGIQGPVGPAGPKGDKGDTGDMGPQGPQGIQGNTGPQGAQGETGPAGTTDYNLLNNLPTLGTAAAQTIDSFATAAQGLKADVAYGWGDHSSEGYLKAVAWNQVTNKPIFETVATTGNYNDLTNKPWLGTAAALNVPSTGNAALDEVVKGNDSRLSDDRTPLAHTHTIAHTTGLQTALDGKATAAQGTKADSALQSVTGTVDEILVTGGDTISLASTITFGVDLAYFALQPTGNATLTGGFDSDEEALGTVTSGTVTPEVDAANKENFKSLTNNGAFTLAPPSTSSACCIRIHVINATSAGAITTTGFDKVFDPDTYATTNAKEYFFYIDHNATRDVLTIREIV